MNTPQIPLDLMLSSPIFSGVNSPRPAQSNNVCATSMAGISPDLALSGMVVDDRALRLGKTTWKHLLDTAIETGHTELYDAEDGQVGLRKPGFRFGPIARMPDIAVPYVREQLAARKSRKKPRHA